MGFSAGRTSDGSNCAMVPTHSPGTAAPCHRQRLAIYDVDGDGRITLESPQQSQVDMLLQADFDKGGQVTLREARQPHGVDAP